MGDPTPGEGTRELGIGGDVRHLVDDIIVAGEEAVIMDFYQKVRENWNMGSHRGSRRRRTSAVPWNGGEKRGRDFFIHQRAYLENLFLDYEENGKRKSLRLLKRWPRLRRRPVSWKDSS